MGNGVAICHRLRRDPSTGNCVAMANGVAICSRLRREDEAAADQYHRDANELEQLIVKEYNGAPLNEREAQLVQVWIVFYHEIYFLNSA
jgi:hypothetical protein